MTMRTRPLPRWLPRQGHGQRGRTQSSPPLIPPGVPEASSHGGKSYLGPGTGYNAPSD